MNFLFSLTKLYGPIITAITCTIIAISIRGAERVPKEIIFNILGIVRFPIFTTNKKIIELLLFFMAILCLAYYSCMDFSSFFPKNLDMQVYYSPKELEKNLAFYSQKELTERHIIYKNFEKYQDEYFKDLDERLRQLVHDSSLVGFFTHSNADIHSEGQTTFIVEKIEGLQNYHLKESKGELTHMLEEPRAAKYEFRSIFEKDKSENDFINPSLWDIVFGRDIIIMPSFKESIEEVFSSSNTKFDHRLFGLTKISIFPYPKFSNTIYLYDKPNVGLIPIGYAIYKEEQSN